MERTDYISMTIIKMGKLKRFLFHCREGRRAGYPICCILRYSIESALADGKTFKFKEGYETSAMRRGMVKVNPQSWFVPCDIFHHKTHDFEEV